MMWSNHLLQKTKQKEKLEAKTSDAPRKMHSAWNN
jgi:hypothetical protein